MGDPSSSDAPSSTTTTTLAGVGLFLLTTALSQWIQNSKHSEQDSTTSERACDGCGLRQLYQSRRSADRLSYEHLPQAALSSPHQDGSSQPHNDGATGANTLGHAPPSFQDTATSTPRIQPSSSSGGAEKTVTEWNLLQRQRRSSVNNLQQQQQFQKQVKEAGMTPLTRNFSEMEVHPNAHYDFHPKNRNWRHFEHYNERDRTRREAARAKQMASAAATGDEPKTKKARSETAVPSTTQSTNEACNSFRLQPLNDMAAKDSGAIPTTEDKKTGFQTCRSASSDLTPFENDITVDTNDDENDDASISSSSDSEEEQFVWTKHRHSSAAANPNKAAGATLSQQRPQIQEQSSTSQATTSVRPPSSALPATTVSFPSRPVQMVRRFLSLDSGEDTLSKREQKVPGHHPVANPNTTTPNLEMYNRQLRAEYNARIMPEKLVLIRHGQSMGNINEVLYSTTPDNQMPLTKLGWEQARNAGKVLRDKILASGESVHFIVSPYVRTVETFHGLVSAWCDPTSEEFASITNHDEKVKAWYGRLMEMGLTWNEDSRLREQDFGNYQNPEVIKRAKEERWRFGAFYYRFPHGESASDVFDRVSTFLDSLWRSFEMNKSQNYVLVTHGIGLRVLLARYFRYTIDQFNTLANPKNCEMVVLGHSGNGKLDLEGRCALDIEDDPQTKEQQVTGYKFHKRLRILPKNAIRKVKIRISPDD